MPEYKFIASDAEGAIMSSTLLADNTEEVRLHVKRLNMQLINIVLIPDAEETTLDKFLNKVNEEDKAQFLEYFASMLEAGLSVSDALQAFYEDLDKPRLRKFIKDAQGMIRNGKNLSEAFETYPDLFPKMYSGMIKVGEASGSLDVSLRQLAEQLKRSNDIKAKVRNAMMYPMIIMTAMGIMVTGLVIFVIPQIAKFFAQSKMDLPIFTKILVWTSEAVQNYWFIIIPGVVGGKYFFDKFAKTPTFQDWWGRASLKIPIIGGLIKTTNVALFMRTFGSLLTSGVNILESLDVVKASMDNNVYVKIADGLKDDISKGNSLSDSMQKHAQYFSPFEMRVISISERTGDIAGGLTNVAVFYEAKLFGLLDNLSSILEPVLLLIMGAVVAVIALSIITPIFQLLTGIESIAS
jgi:general secretion pathway protein F